MSKTPNQLLLESFKDNEGFSNHSIYARMHELGITQEELLPDVQEKVGQLLDSLAINWRHDHNSRDTPRRLAKMYILETMAGRYTPAPQITEFPNVSNLNQLITEVGIKVESLCSHHHQNIRGVCHIGVLPDYAESDNEDTGSVIGLSKFSRIVQYLARRPQIQEELTTQIATYINNIMKPRGIAVMIVAEHQCMACRGVYEHAARTVTTKLLGDFEVFPTLKEEFMSQIMLAAHK